MIKVISYADCLVLWNLLWKDRKTPIEGVSYMKFPSKEIRNLGELKHEYSSSDKLSEPTFLGYYEKCELVGVNSLHEVEGTTRSRGLFVQPLHRNKGIAVALLIETINRSSTKFVWSYPKKEALNTYLRAGFNIESVPIFDSLENKYNFYVGLYKNEV